MAGVVGWWDESSEPEVSDALDALVAASSPDAQDVDKPGDGDKSPFHDIDESVLIALKTSGQDKHLEELAKAPITKEKVEQAKSYVLVGGGNSSNASTYTGTIMFTPLENATSTYTLDYVNLTGQAHRRFQEYEKAFKSVDAALQQLLPKVLGLPSKEYKGLKKETELLARIMEEAKKQGLI